MQPVTCAQCSLYIFSSESQNEGVTALSCNHKIHTLCISTLNECSQCHTVIQNDKKSFIAEVLKKDPLVFITTYFKPFFASWKLLEDYLKTNPFVTIFTAEEEQHDLMEELIQKDYLPLIPTSQNVQTENFFDEEEGCSFSEEDSDMDEPLLIPINGGDSSSEEEWFNTPLLEAIAKNDLNKAMVLFSEMAKFTFPSELRAAIEDGDDTALSKIYENLDPDKQKFVIHFIYIKEFASENKNLTALKILEEMQHYMTA